MDNEDASSLTIQMPITIMKRTEGERERENYSSEKQTEEDSYLRPRITDSF